MKGDGGSSRQGGLISPHPPACPHIPLTLQSSPRAVAVAAGGKGGGVQVAHRFEFGRAGRTKRTLMSAYGPKTAVVPVRWSSPGLARRGHAGKPSLRRSTMA